MWVLLRGMDNLLAHLPYDFIFLLIVTMFLEVLDPPPPPKNAATSNKQCNMRFL
jgi:hypothetical protein